MIVERITLDRMARKRRDFWLPFFIVFAALFIAFLGAFVFGLINHGKSVFQKTLAEDIDQYGFIETGLSSATSEQLSNFYEGLVECDEIEALGAYEYHAAVWLAYSSDLADDDGVSRTIAERQMAAGISEKGEIQNLMVSPGALELCDLNFQVKLTQQEQEALADRITDPVWFYLGSNYADIPLGSCFSFGLETYCLAGILEEGSNFIYDQVLQSTQGLQTQYTVNMDDYMIILWDAPELSSIWYYCAPDGTAVEEAEETILALSASMGVSVVCGRSENVFQNRDTSMQSLIGLLQNFCVTCVLTAVIVMMCTQCIVILRQTKVFGILLSSGMSKRELYASLGLENVAKIIIPLISAIGFSFLNVNTLVNAFKMDQEMSQYIWTVYGLYCVPTMIMLAVCIGVLASVFPVMILRNAAPDRLMKGVL